MLNQETDVSYDIVVSDDGSVDQTAGFMQKYVKTYQDRIIYLQHNNVRRAENRNIGANAASGDLLIFLDADMQATPKFIQGHWESARDNGMQAVNFGPIPVHHSCLNKPIGRYLAGKWDRRINALANDPSDYSLMQSGNFSLWKEFFIELDGFDKTFFEYGGEDVDFFIRSGLRGANFFFSPLSLAYQYTDMKFISFYQKAIFAAQANRLLDLRYPDIRANKSYIYSNSDESDSFKNNIWRFYKKLPFSYSIMLFLIPILEKTLPDDYLFYVYNSLLSKAMSKLS